MSFFFFHLLESSLLNNLVVIDQEAEACLCIRSFGCADVYSTGIVLFQQDRSNYGCCSQRYLKSWNQQVPIPSLVYEYSSVRPSRILYSSFKVPVLLYLSQHTYTQSEGKIQKKTKIIIDSYAQGSRQKYNIYIQNNFVNLPSVNLFLQTREDYLR